MPKVRFRTPIAIEAKPDFFKIQNPSIMKISNLFFFLFLSILFFASCETGTFSDVEPEMNDDRVVSFYTEYEGTVSMSNDLQSFYLEHSDQPERNGYIDIRWSYGEHIYFISEKFEFDVKDCTIWGADSCAKYASNVKEDIEEKGKHWIYFEPSDPFWRCLEAENYDPGDEVFHFHLMAREKGR